MMVDLDTIRDSACLGEHAETLLSECYRLQSVNLELIDFVKKIAHSNPSEKTIKYISEACELFLKNQKFLDKDADVKEVEVEVEVICANCGEYIPTQADAFQLQMGEVNCECLSCGETCDNQIAGEDENE